MQSFKFEIWPVKDFDGDVSGFVVTRWIDSGEEYEDGTPIGKNYAKVHSTMQLAVQEVRLSLDKLQKLYKEEPPKK